jgi:transposase InsO family protein
MIIGLIDEAVARGARQHKACSILGLDPRTVQRWAAGAVEDQRRGPKWSPKNKLSEVERKRILIVVNEPQHRDLPPSQIVPRLADEETYLASESTIYRILREEKQLAHRGRARPRERRRPDSHVASAPGQLWTWDITYLRSPIRGAFFYLYLIMDVWSRGIVGWDVQDQELAELAAPLFEKTCRNEGIEDGVLVLHADNGGPMKGGTMLSTLQRLGVAASFSRPRVSDDNPYSESLFKTMKYRPDYPEVPFRTIEDARSWVAGFVAWYNLEHRHSAIRFVTPQQRHDGTHLAVLERRRKVYKAARERRPERWTGNCRNWTTPNTVELNPGRASSARSNKERRTA